MSTKAEGVPLGDAAPRRHRYPAASLSRDYLRAGIGIAITFPLLLFAEATPAVAVILGGLAALFAGFALRTLGRQFAAVEVGGTAIAVGRKRIPWARLDAVRLRWFGRRRSGAGWMDMRLRGAGTRITIDSELDGFLDIARRAARAAVANGLTLSEATRANFRALGIETGEEPSRR